MCLQNRDIGKFLEPQSSGLKTKAGVSVIQSLFSEPWTFRKIHCLIVWLTRQGLHEAHTVSKTRPFWVEFGSLCYLWWVSAMKSHTYGWPRISWHSTNSFPSERYPITSHECSERLPSSCRWVIAEQNFYYIHRPSVFHCATASIKTSDLKTCSDGLNKSNQDVNESICPPGFLLGFFFLSVFPALNILSPACFWLSFLFAAFGLMSPHSVTVLMESKC